MSRNRSHPGSVHPVQNLASGAILVPTLPGPTLQQYIRHAERFGTECVFETAIADLDAESLGLLSLHLRRVDSRWRLASAQKRALGTALLEIRPSLKAERLCEMAQISQSTLYRLRTELQQVAAPAKLAA